jgi:hypothetical protein
MPVATGVFLGLVAVLMGGFSVLLMFMAWWCRDRPAPVRSTQMNVQAQGVKMADRTASA